MNTTSTVSRTGNTGVPPLSPGPRRVGLSPSIAKYSVFAAIWPSTWERRASNLARRRSREPAGCRRGLPPWNSLLGPTHAEAPSLVKTLPTPPQIGLQWPERAPAVGIETSKTNSLVR